MKGCFLFFFLGISFIVNAQLIAVDSARNERYFEDQFYLGLAYNFISNKPEGLNQRNLSYGLQMGFIKDIPLNTSRTTALGLGLGVSLNTYYSNLLVNETSSGFSYTIDEENETFDRSKLETHLMELPLEFRWRNSTAEEYRFWRIYAGIKAAYVLGARSKLVIDGNSDGFFNTDITRFQYGLTFNFGYNTFNIHAYYALSNLFQDDAQISGESIGFRPLRIGLIFYIL